MITLIVFGTGRNAELTCEALWNLSSEDPEGIHITAFADNSSSRQAAGFLGLPVLSATDAVRAGADFIVVCSQWEREIVAQLRDLGVAPDRVVTPRTVFQAIATHQATMPVRAGGRLVARDAFPRVLILSTETVNDRHGTGVLLQRYFAEFPRHHLFGAALHEGGPSKLVQSIVVSDHGPAAGAFIRASMDAVGFEPDLIFSTALYESDLTVLRSTLEALPARVKAVQHFMDFMPHDEAAFVAACRALLPRLAAVWALTDSLQAMVSSKIGCDVDLVTGLLNRGTLFPRLEHRAFDASFRTIMVGNLYNPDVMDFTREVWRRCRAALPGLGPVEWYVSPDRLQRLLDAGTDPGLDFVWRGFFGGTELLKRLPGADLGLLPLNQDRTATTDYLRYSLPSRLTEFACAGVPLFALAADDTPLARFLARTGMGRTASGPEVEPVVQHLIEFITNREGRSAAGSAGRVLARDEFPIHRFRDWFNGQMMAFAAADTIVSARVA